MMVCFIVIAVMSLAISFLCGYHVGSRDSDDLLRAEGALDVIEAIKKWIDEQNNENGDADR